MAPKVDEKAIEQVQEFANASREDAKTAIRTMDFDVGRAIEYIMSGDLEADRARNSGAKGMLNSLKHIGRSKSPFSHRKSSPVPEVINVSEYEDDDEQLRRALAMSVQDSGGSRGRSPAPGNVSQSRERSPYFGPARASNYENGSWEMVKVENSGQETGVIENDTSMWSTAGTDGQQDPQAPPKERRRSEDIPVVLNTRVAKGTWISEESSLISSLSGLMTILHKIPKAREAILLASPRDPGNEIQPGDGWWYGNQPLQPENTTNDDDTDPTGVSLLREASRAMAFLDGTERSYGQLTEYLKKALQADLAKFSDRGGVRDTNISGSTFLQRWTFIVESSLSKTYLTSPLPHLFQAQVYQPNPDPEQPPLESSLTEILAAVPRELSDAGTYTILDALESTIWCGHRPACIKEFSDILLVRLKRDDHEGGAGVEIFSKLPMGRFAFDFYQTTEEKILLRKGLKETVEKLNKREEELLYITKMGRKYDALKVLEATIQYVSQMEGKKVTVEQSQEIDDIGNRMDIDTETTLPTLFVQLRASLDLLKGRIEEIQRTKQNMQDKLSKIMDFPTSVTRHSPEQAAEGPTPAKPISLVYTLRGVIVDQNLTFFSQWENYTNPYTRKLSWFKSDFSDKPEICPVDESDVLTVARDRGLNGVLTVYVKDDVPEVMDKVLPPDYLRDFIQKDNEVFQRELNPPVVQVSEPAPDETAMDTEEASALPVNPVKDGRQQRSLNPFLNIQDEAAGPPEQAAPTDAPDLMQMSQDDEMVVDKVDQVDDVVVPSVSGETNPFRRQSMEKEEASWRVDQEQQQ